MRYFFHSVVQPLLSAAKPSIIVEIGVARAGHTVLLSEWAVVNGAVLVAVDPKPPSELDVLRASRPDSLAVHSCGSLEALPSIRKPDVVLIDGDHNWYTVFEELRLIERQSERWPLTLLHDIAWPYGRRDMYYDANTVPAQYRQPHRKAGILPGRSELSGEGRNGALLNAEHEGGPRNGVLTAIEDFIDDSPIELELFAAPGPGGLGLLIDRARLDTDASVRAVVREAHNMTFALEVAPRYASRYYDRLDARK